MSNNVSQDLLEQYRNQLNEEKWTRATINNYTINNFEELNELFEKFKEYHVTAEARELTNEYLANNKNSIVALYISTLFQINENVIEDNNVYQLIKIFTDNLKWNIVQYLCEKVLEYLDDKIILRSLLESYDNLNIKDDRTDIWERLIKVDYDEANLVIKLAEIKKQESQIDEAINYYKKAINRLIHNKNFIQTEEVWKELLEYDDIGYDFFLSLDKKISKNFSIDRSIELLSLLYEKNKEKENYDICLKILKIMLEKDPNSEYGRSEIVYVYKQKYKDHSHLEDYIKKSNLEGSWRNINDAIANFEKHIVFDKGNFVYHKTWELGVIKDIDKDKFIIDFQKSKNHTMTLKMALTSLKVIQKNHIWLLKLKNLDKLKSKLKSDKEWALKILISSFENQANMKKFKSELVPDIFSQNEWTSWWNEAKKLLKTNPKFGQLPDKNKTFELRDKPISFEDKIYNSFKTSKNFNERFNLIIDYVNNADPDSDILEDMTNYFTSFINAISNVNEQTFMSFLLLKDIVNKYSFIEIKFPYEFSDYIKEIDDPINIYENIQSSDFKKDFLIKYKKSASDWADTFIRFFYKYPNKYLFDEISLAGREYIERLIKDLTSAYKEYRESFFWMVSNILDEKYIIDMNIDYNNIILSLLHLIELCGKDVDLRKDTVKNRKILNQITNFLFKNDTVISHILNSDKDFAIRLYSIASQLRYLKSEHKIAINDAIAEKFPDIETGRDSIKFVQGNRKDSIIDKLLTTEDSYNKMSDKLQHLQDVEIPENSKEIGIAMEKGDLKENAEFKAAKERQELLKSELTKLSDEISQAIVKSKKDIANDFITFGTKVILIDKINGDKQIEYTILGPWESDSDNNIISYKSPLGAHLLDKEKDQDVKFKLNDRDYHFIIKDIKVADF